MKKFFLAIIFLSVASEAFCASNDVAMDGGYATKADIQRLETHIDDLIVGVNARIDGVEKFLNKRIDDVIVNTNTRINDLRAEMFSGFAGVYRELDNLRHTIYWVIAALGLFLGSPIYGPALKKFFASISAPSISSEDIAALKEILTREKERSRQ